MGSKYHNGIWSATYDFLKKRKNRPTLMYVHYTPDILHTKSGSTYNIFSLYQIYNFRLQIYWCWQRAICFVKKNNLWMDIKRHSTFIEEEEKNSFIHFMHFEIDLIQVLSPESCSSTRKKPFLIPQTVKYTS